MAYLAVPETGQAVQVFVAFVIPVLRPFTPDDVHEGGFSLGRGGEGVKQRMVVMGHSNSLLIGPEGIPGRMSWRSGVRVSTPPMTRSTTMVAAVTVQATVSPEES